jgi:hypothetical protein
MSMSCHRHGRALRSAGEAGLLQDQDGGQDEQHRADADQRVADGVQLEGAADPDQNGPLWVAFFRSAARRFKVGLASRASGPLRAPARSGPPRSDGTPSIALARSHAHRLCEEHTGRFV